MPPVTQVPAAATMYCMGVEAYTSEVSGFDMSAFNKYRWDKTYESTRMQDVRYVPGDEQGPFASTPHSFSFESLLNSRVLLYFLVVRP